MTKFIPARPAHPIDAPPLHPFMGQAPWNEADIAYSDAMIALRHADFFAVAMASRPPLPVGQGLSL